MRSPSKNEITQRRAGWLSGPAGLFAVTLVALVAPARAEEVHLDNGERLTGTIVKRQDDSLVLEQRSADGEGRLRLTIPRDRIVEVLPRARNFRELLDAGERALAERRFERAIGHFQEAQARNPRQVAPWGGQIRVLAAEGEFARGERKLRAAWLLFPGSADLLLAAGELYARQRRFGAARKALNALDAVAKRSRQWKASAEALRALIERLEAEAAQVPAQAPPQAPTPLPPPVLTQAPTPPVALEKLGPAAGTMENPTPYSGDPEIRANTDRARHAGAGLTPLVKSLAAEHQPLVLRVDISETPVDRGPLKEYRDDPGGMGNRYFTHRVNVEVHVVPSTWVLMPGLDQQALLAAWYYRLERFYPSAAIRLVVRWRGQLAAQVFWSQARGGPKAVLYRVQGTD